MKFLERTMLLEVGYPFTCHFLRKQSWQRKLLMDPGFSKATTTEFSSLSTTTVKNSQENMMEGVVDVKANTPIA